MKMYDVVVRYGSGKEFRESLLFQEEAKTVFEAFCNFAMCTEGAITRVGLWDRSRNEYEATLTF